MQHVAVTYNSSCLLENVPIAIHLNVLVHEEKIAVHVSDEVKSKMKVLVFSIHFEYQ